MSEQIYPKNISWVTAYISLGRMLNFSKVHKCF